MQHVVVIPYRRFGITYQEFSTLEDLIRYVVPKCQYGIITTCCVIAQKSAFLIYFAAEAIDPAENLLSPPGPKQRTEQPIANGCCYYAIQGP